VVAKATEEEAMTLAAETSRHGGKLAGMVDPSEGNKIVTTMVHDAVATKVRIMDPAIMTTKGKAPVAMTRRTTKIQVHIARMEAVIAAEIGRMTLRANRGVAHPHHHQEVPWRWRWWRTSMVP
jgi:hypothetical protein